MRLRRVSTVTAIQPLRLVEDTCDLLIGVGTFLFVYPSYGFYFFVQGFRCPSTAVRFTEEELQLRHCSRAGSTVEFTKRVDFEIFEHVHRQVGHETHVTIVGEVFKSRQDETMMSQHSGGNRWSMSIEMATDTVREG